MLRGAPKGRPLSSQPGYHAPLAHNDNRFANDLPVLAVVNAPRSGARCGRCSATPSPRSATTCENIRRKQAMLSHHCELGPVNLQNPKPRPTQPQLFAAAVPRSKTTSEPQHAAPARQGESRWRQRSGRERTPQSARPISNPACWEAGGAAEEGGAARDTFNCDSNLGGFVAAASGRAARAGWCRVIRQH